MKRIKINNKCKAVGYILVSISLLLSSCVKSRPGETNFSQLKPIVLIPEGGLSTFSSEALVFPATDVSDTADFHVNYAATNVAPAEETVTLAIDTAAITSFNNASVIQYVLAPDSIFSFTTTAVTVPKVDNYSSPVPLVVYPSKVDPTKNYMIP